MKRDSLITVGLIEEVLAIVYASHECPQMVHYEEAVAELKCEKLELKPGSYTKRQVHTSVWRALKQLVESGDVIKDGKYYYGKEEYADYSGKNDFRKYVHPASYEFVMMSENTVVIKLEQAENHDAINSAVIRKLGENRVYTSFVYDKVLIIVFYKDAFDYDCVQDLSSAISEAYQYNVLKDNNT